MSLQTKDIYEFEGFRLDRSERTLQLEGKTISLTPKVFETLCVLVEEAGHLISKDLLMQKLWPDRAVEESNLTFNIKMLRKALGDSAQNPRFIETVTSHGYRFIAKVDQVSEPVTEPAASSAGPIAVRAGPSEQPMRSAPALDGAAARPVVKTRAPRVILFSVGFVSAILLALLLSSNFRSRPPVDSGQVKSIAVLPLKPLTAENRDPSYELGIADSLILKLSSTKGLVVRSLSATRQYVDIEEDALSIGRDQKVDYVLASTYQISDGKVRITSQLYNVQSGLVEGTYKVELDNSTIFAIQDAVAEKIGGQLLAQLQREPNNNLAKRYTNNEEAYRLFIRGTVMAGKLNGEDIAKAIDYFEQAVRLDPNFALAYAWLGSAYNFGSSVGAGASPADYLKAKTAIEKALAIDNNLAEAHSYSGAIKADYERDFSGAEREHRRALELNPNSTVAHRSYALLLGILGRPDESINEIKAAIDLEPASTVNHHVHGWLLYQAHRYDEAITEEQRVLEMDPEYFFAYNVLTNSYRFKGEDDKAFESFVQMQTLSGSDPEEIALKKAIYARAGWRGIAEHNLAKAQAAEKKGNPDYDQLARMSIDLGQYEAAIAYLEKAVANPTSAPTTLKVNPKYDPLRSDPRFDALLKRVGFN